MHSRTEMLGILKRGQRENHLPVVFCSVLQRMSSCVTGASAAVASNRTRSQQWPRPPTDAACVRVSTCWSAGSRRWLTSRREWATSSVPAVVSCAPMNMLVVMRAPKRLPLMLSPPPPLLMLLMLFIEANSAGNLFATGKKSYVDVFHCLYRCSILIFDLC